MKRIICIIIIFFSFGFMKESKPDNIKTTSPRRPRSQWLLPVGVQSMNPADAPNTPNKSAVGSHDDLVRIHPPHSSHGQNTSRRECDWGNCWELSYMDENDAYYYLGSGGENDTFAVIFQPLAPCVVQEVYVQWFSSGTVTAFGADYGSASEISPNGDCYDIPQGSTNLSPIGTIRTPPTESYIEGYNSDWDSDALLNIGGTFQVGDETNLSDVPLFVIGLVKHGDTPQPLAMNNEITGRTESYTWFGGPWNADSLGIWGRYSSTTDIMMMVRVQYPFDWDNPPICVPEQLSNTYTTSGTRTLKADCFDDVDENGIGISQDDNITIYFQQNGVTYDSTSIGEAIPIDVDDSGNGVWQFELNYSGLPGDDISYFSQSVSGSGIPYPNPVKTFQIRAPVNPDADILLINDNAGNYYLGGYELSLEMNGYIYEVWNVLNNHGIDDSVINHGWSNIIVFGWGNLTLPVIADEEDPGYGDFLSNGGNLMLIDQDWLYGHGLDSYPTALTFVPGDPAYDWFGISGGMNDPDYNDDSSDGGAGDTTIISLLPGLTDLALRPSIYTTANWTDFITPDAAEAVYQGFDTEEIVGVRLDNGTSKTALFSFMADATVDSLDDETVGYTQEFYDFMSYFLAWFAPASPPLCEITSGPSGTVFGSADQAVTANCSDVQGDAFTVDLEWSTDGGASWSSAGMSDNGGGAFSGLVPGQAGGTNVSYRLSATNGNGTFTTPEGSYFVYAPSSPILFVLNNEMDPGSYPGMYYFYDSFGDGDLWIWPDFWTGGVTAELLSFYDIVFEITSTGTWADFTDHYDVIHSWLDDGGKRYFLAGDETFGLLNGTWADEDFAPGSFFNDMGIAHSYNDLGNGGTSVLNAVQEDLISGDLYNGILELGDGSILLYDPGDEIGLNNFLDGVEPAADAVPFLFDDASGHAVGVYKPWSNGNRTVFCGFDPLSLNSSPTYRWWGASASGITKKTLDWFTQIDCSTGDLNGDTHVDILDVVQAVACILETSDDGDCACDFNHDDTFDVLDIVILVGWIFSG